MKFVLPLINLFSTTLLRAHVPTLLLATSKGSKPPGVIQWNYGILEKAARLFPSPFVRNAGSVNVALISFRFDQS